MKNNKIAILLLILLAFIGCKRVEEPAPLGKEYFPLEIGKYRSYIVDSMWYDAFNETKDSAIYYVRETIKDTFTDNEGRLAYFIESEYRSDTLYPWKLKNVITELITNFEAERTEFNNRLIKLSLPVRERKSWDENAFNVDDKQTNRYRDVGEPYTIGNRTFENTVRIDQGNDVDPFFVFVAEERYAFNVGLIYKSLTDTETQNGVTSGISYTKTLYDTNW